MQIAEFFFFRMIKWHLFLNPHKLKEVISRKKRKEKELAQLIYNIFKINKWMKWYRNSIFILKI